MSFDEERPSWINLFDPNKSFFSRTKNSMRKKERKNFWINWTILKVPAKPEERNCHLPTANCQLLSTVCQRPTAHGQEPTAVYCLPTANSQQPTANWRLRTFNLLIGNWQLLGGGDTGAVDWPLATGNDQLATANCQSVWSKRIILF